jgi:putative ABC transport system permease protein
MINASLIEIADRVRDVATFRVLGYRPGQVAGIFFRQNLVVFAAGLLLGMPIGYGLMVMAAKAYESELFRMPVVIRPISLIETAGISFVFMLIAQVIVHWQVRKLKWLEGIQFKE